MICFKVADLGSMNRQLSSFLEYLENMHVNADAVFDSRLISCELITNALKHSGGVADFCGAIGEGEIVISVRSDSINKNIVVPQLPDALAEGGRGLYIVNEISGGNVIISGGTVTVKLKI